VYGYFSVAGVSQGSVPAAFLAGAVSSQHANPLLGTVLVCVATCFVVLCSCAARLLACDLLYPLLDCCNAFGLINIAQLGGVNEHMLVGLMVTPADEWKPSGAGEWCDGLCALHAERSTHVHMC
jgi:hypothetical protein